MLELVLGVLCLVGSAGWWLAAAPPTVAFELWQAVTWGGAALLGVGLVRDLYIKFVKKPDREPRRAGEKLICLESLLGGILVLTGLIFLVGEVKRGFDLPAPVVGLGAGLIFIVSGGIKDVVVVFKKEKDHQNVIPW